MHPQDEEIAEMYYRLEEARRQRMRLVRIWQPETLRWKRGQGEPPKETWSTRIRRRALAKELAGRKALDFWKKREIELRNALSELAKDHPLYEHFERISGLGSYSCGAFVAAAGDIERANTVSQFWRGMGLAVTDEGTAAKKVRGKQGIPCPRHVTTIGEQIRMNIIRSDGKLRTLYDKHKARYAYERPEWKKHHIHRAAVRVVQKILYAALWTEFRKARGLPSQIPYPFAMLQLGQGHKLLTIFDLYDDAPDLPDLNTAVA